MFNNNARSCIVFMFVGLVVIGLLYFVEIQVFRLFDYMIIILNSEWSNECIDFTFL